MLKLPEFSALEKALRGIKPSTREYYVIELRNFLQWLDEKGYFKAVGNLETPRKGISLEEMPNLVQTAETFKTEAKARAKEDDDWAEECIARYLEYRKEIVETFPRDKQGSKVSNLIDKPIKALKKFCKKNKINVDWEDATDGLPKANGYANDSKIELEQIQKLLKQRSADPLRANAVFLTLASCGMDVGAFEHLKWSHVKPIERDGKVVCASLHTYRMKSRGGMKPYDTLITPEAYFALKAYMDDRYDAGEKNVREHPELTPLIRTVYRLRSRWNGGPTEPKSLHKDGVEEIVGGALVSSGIRKKLPAGETRHEFQTTKAFRKFYTTMMEDAGVPEKIFAQLRGDKVQFRTGSYRRPTDRDPNVPYQSKDLKELVDQYLKAVPLLTVTPEARQGLNIEKTVEERLEKELSTKTKKLEDIERRLLIQESLNKAKDYEFESQDVEAKQQWAEEHRDEAEELDALDKAELSKEISQWLNSPMGKLAIRRAQRLAKRMTP